MPLKDMYKHHLLEKVNYKNEVDAVNIFNKIKVDFNIHSVQKVNNPQLFGMYLLHKEELEANDKNKVKEHIMYHATSKYNVQSIIKNNIDWRYTTRSRFGRGACFSPDPYYAHSHASSIGVFVIFKVVTKNFETTSVNYGLKVPYNIHTDTTVDQQMNVYVKYNDNEFYPIYVVHYSEKFEEYQDLFYCHNYYDYFNQL
ncbi:zinc finger CCCH-type antiviral protein 1-like isoform X2 [Adelges cooleyi]|nr:zinc finger CCCH-type antiviral protein 1-like isoform X2 [Adelges cooleyi]